MKKVIGQFLTLALAVFLGACGSSSSGLDTTSCPPWNPGDSMTYLRTETVSGNSTETTMTYVVTERTADSVTLSDGTTTKIYSINAGRYIPVSEEEPDARPDDNFFGSSTTYTSATAFCPPPSVGAGYEYRTSLSGPVPGTGEAVTTALLVTSVSTAPVSVLAGTFVAKKIIMDKTLYWDHETVTGGTVTRYYAGGIGVVKAVEEIPSENKTITEELTAYSY